MQRLDVHFRAVAGQALQRHGAAYADLLSHWPAIAGEDMAAIARPERLGRPGKGGDAGTLVVRAAEGRALDVQHEAPRLIERINGFFGYGAIARIKVLQGPLPPPKAPRRAPAEPPEAAASAVDRQVARVADARLKDALRRLGRSRAVSNTSR